MHATSFMHSLLSVNVDVCMYVCLSTSLRLNISETKGDSGLFPIVSLKESAQGESNGHVTHDVT